MLTGYIHIDIVAITTQKKGSYSLATVFTSDTKSGVERYSAIFLCDVSPYPNFQGYIEVGDFYSPLVSVCASLPTCFDVALSVFGKTKGLPVNSFYKRRSIMTINATVTPAVHQVSQSNPYAFPEEHPYYLITLKNPTIPISITKKDCSDKFGRYVDFKTGIFFKINPDNSIDLSDFQFNQIMDIISMELSKFINDGFPRNSKPIQEDVFNITNNKKGEIPMANQLIPINTDENGQQTVNARDLHEFLEVGKDFTNWIKDRILQYDFVENQDFILLANSGEQTCNAGRGGHNKQEYHITIDMAKELSMVEKNAKGKEARKYFIMCERIAKELTKPRELTTLEILELALKNEKAKLAAIAERDDAIKTKAWIGDKKVATSMATASVAVRQAESLKEQIGDSKTWKTVKAIPWLKDVFELSKPAYKAIGVQLAKISKAIGYSTKKVPDTEWGAINAYHSDVIEQFKNKLSFDLNMLRTYRRPLN